MCGMYGNEWFWVDLTPSKRWYSLGNIGVSAICRSSQKSEFLLKKWKSASELYFCVFTIFLASPHFFTKIQHFLALFLIYSAVASRTVAPLGAPGPPLFHQNGLSHIDFLQFFPILAQNEDPLATKNPREAWAPQEFFGGILTDIVFYKSKCCLLELNIVF